MIHGRGMGRHFNADKKCVHRPGSYLSTHPSTALHHRPVNAKRRLGVAAFWAFFALLVVPTHPSTGLLTLPCLLGGGGALNWCSQVCTMLLGGGVWEWRRPKPRSTHDLESTAAGETREIWSDCSAAFPCYPGHQSLCACQLTSDSWVWSLSFPEVSNPMKTRGLGGRLLLHMQKDEAEPKRI